MIVCGAPVPLMTTSAVANSDRSASSGTACPPSAAASAAARSKVRPPTTVARAPSRTSRRAASSLILPAPTSRTFLSFSSPKILRASSTATWEMETAFLPMPVSWRTRLAAERLRLRRAPRVGPSVPAASAVW